MAVIENFKKPFFLASLICIFIFYSGIFIIPERNLFNSLIDRGEIVALEGEIISTPVKMSSGKYYSSILQASGVEGREGKKSSAYGRVKLYIPTEMIEIYFPGKIYSAAFKKGSFLYEAGGFFSFRGRLSGTGAGSGDGFYVSSCTSSRWPSTILGKIDFFRALCRLHFKRLMFKWGEAGGLLLALLSGSREYTDFQTADAFRNAGLSHILALSGMHLSMFSAIAILLGDIVGRKKITYLIRIIALILFVWFAGFSPSLLRAFICASLSLMAAMNSSSKTDLVLILSFSFILQCIISPSDIHNIGFIMSYGALAGILLTSNFFRYIYSKFMPKALANSLSASTGAQFITAPVSLKVFGSFCPVGVIATSMVSPLVTVFIYSGLALIILSLAIPVLQAPSGIFINLQYNIIKFFVILFSRTPKIQI